MWTIGSLLEKAVLKHPKRPALVSLSDGGSLNYRQWDQQVNALAHGLLALGLAKGDRVATFLGNTAELVTVLFATAKVGGVFNPVNYQLSPAELALILNDSEAKILFYGAGERDKVEQAQSKIETVQQYVDADADADVTGAQSSIPYRQLISGMPVDPPGLPVLENDWYAVLYTSGTTRKPRGVIHRHRSIVEHSLCMVQSQQLTCHDRGLSLTPLYHVAELHAFLIPRVQVGAANILWPHFDPAVFAHLLDQQQVTVVFADPPRWGQILQQTPPGAQWPHLRLIASGGSALHPTLATGLRQMFPVSMVHYYGSTEMGPVVTALNVSTQSDKAGSVGLPLVNHEVRVVRPDKLYPAHPDHVLPPGMEGEVLVRGVGMMQGYYNHPELTAAALYGGWYHTGDMGYFDQDGCLWLLGRRDDAIVAGVDNIYPQEIEAVLLEHPDIIEAAVVGLESRHWQTALLAVIVSKNKNLAALDVESFLRQSRRLADYKIPRLYQFVQELPMVTTGKVQKIKLLQKYNKKG